MYHNFEIGDRVIKYFKHPSSNTSVEVGDIGIVIKIVKFGAEIRLKNGRVALCQNKNDFFRKLTFKELIEDINQNVKETINK